MAYLVKIVFKKKYRIKYYKACKVAWSDYQGLCEKCKSAKVTLAEEYRLLKSSLKIIAANTALEQARNAVNEFWGNWVKATWEMVKQEK